MFNVRIGAAHGRWQACHVILPRSLAGTEVRIDAFSQIKAAHIGFGTPYYRTDYPIPGLHFARLATATSISLLYLILLFFPGFNLLRHGVTKLRFDDRLSVTLIVTLLICFLLFFVSSFAPTLGKIIVFAWLLLAFCWVMAEARGRSHRAGFRQRYLLLILAACLTVFQAAFVFSFGTVSVGYSSNYVFSPASWSTDNQIPPETAILLTRGLPLSEWPFAPWKLSDKTPLLACLLYPIAVVLGCFPGLPRSPLGNMVLQTCGFGLLNLWIIPAWTLFRRLRFTQKDCLLACLFTAATPFVFFNSIYVWPKMLAGTLCLTRFLYLPARSDHRQKPGIRWQILVSGISADLAIMAHSGIILAVAAVYAGGAIIGRHACKLKGSPRSARFTGVEHKSESTAGSLDMHAAREQNELQFKNIPNLENSCMLRIKLFHTKDRRRAASRAMDLVLPLSLALPCKTMGFLTRTPGCYPKTSPSADGKCAFVLTPTELRENIMTASG